MTMNALHVITLLVACFNAFVSIVTSTVITEPPPQDLCDIDITIADWKNYDVVRLNSTVCFARGKIKLLLLLSSTFLPPTRNMIK